jgi:ribulose 1,5-bisphosphate synthetase/thiazole synthase
MVAGSTPGDTSLHGKVNVTELQQTATAALDCDVFVVGGGPAGSTIAALLGNAAIK